MYEKSYKVPGGHFQHSRPVRLNALHAKMFLELACKKDKYQMAASFGISHRTVEGHFCQMFDIIGVVALPGRRKRDPNILRQWPVDKRLVIDINGVLCLNNEFLIEKPDSS